MQALVAVDHCVGGLGDLNVMSLLVYDRPLAERIVSDRYPSEGPHYLEKVVLASFELPDPSALDVQQHLAEFVESILRMLIA